MWGWAADECHSISGALALLRGGQYDLTLCDVDLPDGNGIFLAAALAKAKPSLLVVVVSGSPENVALARRSGFRCLQKPFDLDALKTLIENHPQAVPS
jgi:DNA-binding response OmpR family regulator